MATYFAESDGYAGFDSTGKYFGCFGLADGVVALVGWAAMHGHLSWLQPTDASDQLLISAMTWVGSGLAVIMAVVTLGSLVLSSQSRGAVIVDDQGVTRQIDDRSWMLRWDEIEGSVMAQTDGGTVLIPREGGKIIAIPRSLEDYRGCIAEIEARGVRRLPPDNTQVRNLSCGI